MHTEEGMIQRPCNNDWKQMAGDDRRRYCADCGKDVHAVSGYSDAEWAAMAASGNICAYWEGETPSAPRSRRAIVAGALLTTISPLLAQEGCLRVTALDTSGAAIANADVIVTSPDGKERTKRTDAKGIADFTGLPLGTSSVRVSQAGFKLWRKTHSVTGASEPIRAELQVGEVLTGVVVMTGEPKKRFRFWRRR